MKQNLLTLKISVRRRDLNMPIPVDDLTIEFYMFQSFTVFGKDDDLNVSVLAKAVTKSSFFYKECRV